MTEAMYQDEIEAVVDQFQAGVIDEAQFRSRMRGLGFDADEIDDYYGDVIADVREMVGQ